MHSPHLFLHLYPAFLFSSMSPLRRHGHFAVIAPVCFTSRILAQAVFSTQNVFFLLFYLVTTHSSDFIRASLLQRCLLQFPDETKCPYYRIIWNYISILYSICLFFFAELLAQNLPTRLKATWGWAMSFLFTSVSLAPNTVPQTK